MEIKRLNRNGKWEITFITVEQITLRRLAHAYAITDEAMVVCCFNKGLDVIGKQVQQTDEHKKHEDGYNGTD